MNFKNFKRIEMQLYFIVLHLLCFSFSSGVNFQNASVYTNPDFNDFHQENNITGIVSTHKPFSLTETDYLKPQIAIFDNSSHLPHLEKQIVFDENDRKYRKRYGNGGGGYAYANSYGSYGGGGYGSYGGYGGGGGGGWNGKKGKPNHHYDPSVNKYGGGGPLSNDGGHNSNPGKGQFPQRTPNYGSSYVPNIPNIGKGQGGVGGGGHAGGGATAGGGGFHGGGGGGGVGVGTGVLVPEDNMRIVICEVVEKCHAFTLCASYSNDYLRTKDRCCIQTKKISKGMCCDGNYPDGTGTGGHLNAYATDTVSVPDISQSSLQSAASKGYEYHSTYRTIENRLQELNIVVEKGTAAHGHLLFFQTTASILQVARENLLTIKATNYIQDTYFLTNAEAGIGLQGYDYGGTVFEKTCPATPKCDTFNIYRTLDGSCNNPRSPKLGQSGTPLIRLLPPDYADGVWAPRVRRDGSPLPSARFITLNLVHDANFPDPRYSHILMQFGQFIDHDLSHVPIFRFGDLTTGIQCCSSIQSDVSHPACFPIEIPQNDFNLRGQRCMNFVRSMIAPRLDCSFGHADQLNQLTHWLDASQIYGSTFERGETLREFSGGRMRISREGGREFLPENENLECRNTAVTNSHCYVAGDRRVNEQIGLTSMHTIFLREHNRIAYQLSSKNPLWDDETLYQETRRIVTAEYQHIIYNEWLPLIIGRNYMVTFGILPLYNGYYKGYDSAIDASVSNAFTTAAFRMGHTLVQGTFNLESNGGGNVGQLVLRDFFNNPSILPEPGLLDSLTEGLLTQPIQRFDNYVTTELRDHLFETPNSPGMDLIALNVQRGRDHGLPSYNEYRDLCRLGKARDFSDLSPVIHPRKIPQLERIYGNVDDIDLYIGGIHETPLPGAVVGPTFACIIGDQFVRSKRGDMYFYDIGGKPHSFTPNQLHEIRSVSLSRIICDNTDEIQSIQPLAFHLPNSAYNPMLPCSSPSISRVNLRAWEE